MVLSVLVALIVFILDQFGKTFLFTSPGDFVLNDSIYIVLMLPFFVSFLIFMYKYRKIFLHTSMFHSAMGLVIGGALSNILDVLSRDGVVDYFSLLKFTHFNLADVAIIVGISYLTYLIFVSR